MAFDQYINKFVDSVNGAAGNTGDSWESPWTLAKAATTAPTANCSYNIFVKNNGWTTPYRSDTTAALISPNYAGYDVTHPNRWFLNGNPNAPADSGLNIPAGCAYVNAPGAPLTASRRIAYDDWTWERVGGSSNIYRTATPLAYNPYQLMVGGTNHWFVTDKVPVTCLNVGRVPFNSEIFCWWYSSAEGYVYYCDPYGNPNSQTDIWFETAPQSGSPLDAASSVIDLNASCNYHSFYNGVLLSGGNANYTVRFTQIGSLFYNILACAPQYGFVRSVSNGSQFIYNQFLTINDSSENGQLVLSSGSANNLVYNNLFYGDAYAVYLANDSGAGGANAIKNNLFVDNNQCFRLGTGISYTEDYNAFGLCNRVYPSGALTATTIGLTSGANSIPPGATTSTTEILFYDTLTGNFKLLYGSPLIDAGADLSLGRDFVNNPVSSYPDIGTYEYIASLGSITLSIEIEI